MQKKNLYQLTLLLILAFGWASPLPAVVPEPIIADYTNYPIFQVNAVTPNILIILDNSGSMNFNAYGTYTGDSGEVVEPFNGAPPFCNVTASGVIQDDDNVETYANPAVSTYVSTTDDELDLGTFNGDGAAQSIVAVRFQNVEVPRGRTITRAYIQFTAHTGQVAKYDNATTVKIRALEEDNPGDAGSMTQNELIGASLTTAFTDWNIPPWTAANQRDNDTRTPDFSNVVQAIVDRSGWQSGNSMVLFISEGVGDGFREIFSFNGATGVARADYAPQLYIEFDPLPEDCTRYYGYFDPDSRYRWDTNRFVRDDAAGDWDGNWLNWCTMRRIDVLRKVLMGGLATARSGGGNQVNYGETPNQANRIFKRHFVGSGFTPDPSSNGGDYWYTLEGGYVYMDADDNTGNGYIARYDVKVQKDATHPNEARDFVDGNLAGVLQKIGDKARWGNEWFYEGTGANKSGGFIDHRIGSNMTTLITDLQNTGADTWTPLAEAYYVAMQYFKQEACDTSLDFKSGASGPLNNTNDPYYNGTEFVRCAKSFVILLTDGASTMDSKLPANLKDYDNDANDNTACDESADTDCDYPSGGTNYLDDIALYARTNDLRNDLDGEQNMILYAIYAFGNDDNARQLLKDAAKNGGFIDRNGNNLPDLQVEWDADSDGDPDTYYEAQDGYKLESQLLIAINDILKRAASGTAVSVLATKGEGEGTLVQAFFKPSVPVGVDEIKWTGYIQSLWIDRFGNTREDTNGNHRLDIAEDNIIRFFLDPATGETKVKVLFVSAGSEFPDNDTWSPDDTISLEQIKAIWEGGGKLADRDADDRKLFTYLSDASSAFADNAFTTANAAGLGIFFGVEDNATWGYLGAGYNDRVDNIIHFVRGILDNSTDYSGSPNIRGRTMEDGRLWKLGDIVYSTPVSISKPVENYGLIYDDLSYKSFFQRYKNRETVVYVGANDGMLHAFTSGVYDSVDLTFKKISQVSGGYSLPDTLAAGDIDIGDELWAYIPRNLLAHLKWLPYQEYTHVNYVDLKPKVIDARIFDNSTIHPDGWGTILIGGMNMGGKQIATDNGTYYSSYFALDVTNPRAPELLWEKNFPKLAFTTNTPCVVSVGNQWNGTSWSNGKWFLAISSGPTAYDGSSTQEGHVYIIDLLTGTMLRDFDTPEPNAYMNSPVAFDKGLNYNVDSIYVSANFGSWEGRLYKITIPQSGATDFDPFSTDYDDDPLNWTRSKLFHSPEPITAPVSVSVDTRDNAWIFAGTGRFIEEADKSTSDQNYFFGIKDPFFNTDRFDTTCFYKYNTECEINAAGLATFPELLDADVYTVKQGGLVEGGGLAAGAGFGDLLNEARVNTYDGWFRRMCPDSVDNAGNCLGSGPSERVLNKPAMLGGIALFPTFAPNDDPCGFGGNARLFAVFYETGTAFKNRVMGPKVQTTIVDVIGLGEGISSSFGVHIGREEGGTIYGQMSTGVIQQINIIPAFQPKSKPLYWKEMD